MKHIYKASSLFAKLRSRNWTQHKPNTTTEGHNDDQPGQDFTKGRHPKTRGIVSDYDWNAHPFKYHWNSLGLRGPEPNPNADRKILAIGNSLTLGSGVPLEDSYIYKTAKQLNADYINLSDNFVLTDIIKPAKEIIKWYQPNIIYLNETRFIDASSFVAWHMVKEGNKLDNDDLKDLIIDGMCNTINMFEDTLRYYAPNAKVIWDITTSDKPLRKSFLGDVFDSKRVISSLTFPVHTFLNTDILLDLGRDGKHPGIKGNDWMSKRLVNIIGEYFE